MQLCYRTCLTMSSENPVFTRFYLAFPGAVMLDYDVIKKDSNYTEPLSKNYPDCKRYCIRRELNHWAIFKQNEMINTATCQEVFSGDAYDVVGDNIIPTFTQWKLTHFKDFKQFERFEWLMVDPQIAEHYQNSLWIQKETSDVSPIEWSDQLPY